MVTIILLALPKSSIFEDSKLGFSYSHISNNDWGETNPGTFEGISGVDTTYVGVDIGVFTDGFVEVSGNISEGMIVVVPRWVLQHNQ